MRGRLAPLDDVIHTIESWRDIPWGVGLTQSQHVNAARTLKHHPEITLQTLASRCTVAQCRKCLPEASRLEKKSRKLQLRICRYLQKNPNKITGKNVFIQLALNRSHVVFNREMVIARPAGWQRKVLSRMSSRYSMQSSAARKSFEYLARLAKEHWHFNQVVLCNKYASYIS